MTKLAAWIRSRGAARVATELRPWIGFEISRSAVYHWAAGRRTPRYAIARALVRASGGQLSFDDVLGMRRKDGEAKR